MSWARDEWKEGLSAQALRKVSEYEENLERNRKELQQRQFQLDSLNAALQKQKILTEEQKTVGNQYKRELQMVSEKCDTYEKTQQKIMADLHTKESRITCLDGLLSTERQALESEVAKCNRFRMDLEENTAKHDKLLSDYNKLQKDVQVQQRKASYRENGAGNTPCPSASDSDSEKEVFSVPKLTPRNPVPQSVEVIPVKPRTSSSSSIEDGVQNFHTPSQQTKIKELQRQLENVRKEKDILSDKWQKSVHDLDVSNSKLMAMEVKQKQLVQEIECSRHNVEAGRRHQEERMKEKEREYREEISTQSKSLMDLEQELKETKIKLDQQQKSSDVKLKEFDANTKKLQNEMVKAEEALKVLEFEKSEKSRAIEKYESAIAELRIELIGAKQNKDVTLINQQESIKTIQTLKQQIEMQRSELEESKQMVNRLEESIESQVAQERVKYLDLLKTREEERNMAVAKSKELEKSLEESNISNLEKENVLNLRIEELRSQAEKTAPLLEQREQQFNILKISVEEKTKENQSMAAMLEKCSDPSELRKMSEEKALLEGKLTAAHELCESLKQKVKETEAEVSQMEAQRQMLQIDMEDKEQTIVTLVEQKATLESGLREKLHKLSQNEENLRISSDQVDFLKNENENLKMDLSERKRIEMQLREQLSSKNDVLENALTSKKALAQELSKISKERDETCTAYETKTAELERVMNELRCERDVLAQNTVTELKKKLETVEKSLEEKCTEICDLNLLHKALEDESCALKAKLEKITDNVENMKTNMTSVSSEKLSLVSNLKKLEEERDNQINLLSEMEATILEKDRMIGSLRTSQNDILENRNTELLSIETKMKKLSEEYQGTSEMLSQESEKVNLLTGERDRLKESVERLRGELLDRDHERKEFASQQQEFEKTCTENKDMVNKLEADLSSALELAQKERESFEEKLYNLNKELISCKECSQERNNKLRELSNHLESLKLENECLAIENEKLKMDRGVLSQKADEISNRCNEFSEKLEEKEKAIHEYKFTVEQLGSELATAKEANESTKNQLNEDFTKLKEELSGEKENLSTARRDLEEKLARISSLQSEKESLEVELENEKSAKEKLSCSYENSLIENKILVGKLAASNQEIGESKKECERQRIELESANSMVKTTEATFSKDLGDLRLELMKEKEKLEMAKIDLKEKETEVAILKSTQESQKFEMENIQSEKQGILKKYEKSAEDIQIIAEELDASAEQANKYKTAYEQLEDELVDVKRLTEATQTKLNDDLKNVRHALEEEKRKLEAALENIKGKELAIHSLSHDKAILEFEIDNMKFENKAISEKYDTAVSEGSASVERLKVGEQEVIELKIKLEQLQQELKDSQCLTECTQVNAFEEVSNLRNELGEEKIKIQAVRDGLMEKDTTIQTIMSEKESLVFEVRTLKAENEVHLENLDRIFSEKKTSLEKLARCEQQLRELKLINDQLQQQLTQAKDVLEASRNAVDEQMAKLLNELNQTNAKLETTEKDVKEKDVSLQMINSEKESLLFEIENVKEDNAIILEKLERSLIESKSASEKVSVSEQLVGEYKVKVEQMQQELTEAKISMESNRESVDKNLMRLQKELTHEKAKHEATKNELSEKDTVLQVLNTEKDSLLFEIENLKSEKKTCLEKIDRTTNDLKLTYEKLFASDQKMTDQELTVEQLNRENLELKKIMGTNQETVDEDLRRLRNEISEEKEKLETARNEVKDKDAAIQILNTEKEALRFEIKSLKSENQMNMQKIERSLDESKVSVEKLAFSEEQVKEYKIVVETIQRELTEARHDKEAAQATQDERLRKLQDDLVEEKAKLEKAFGDLKDKEATVQMLTNEKQSFLFEIENMKTEKLVDLEKIEKLRNEAMLSLEKLTVSEQQVADLKITVEQLQREVTGSKEIQESRQASFDADIKNFKDQLLNEKEKLEKVTRDHQESMTTVSIINTKKASLEFEVDQLKCHNETLCDKLEIVQQQCCSYEAKLAESDKLAADYETKESVVKDLREKLNQKDDELHQEKVKFDVMKAKNSLEITELNENLDKKQALLVEKEYELDQLKKQICDQLKSMREAEQEMKRQKEKNEMKVAELEKEVDRVRQLCDQKVKERQEVMMEVESMRSQLEEKIAAALLNDKECEREREKLVKQIENAARDVKEIEKNLLRKEETIYNLEQQLMARVDQKDREHIEAVMAVKEENDRLHDKMRQRETENDKLRQEINSVKQSFENQIKEKNRRLLELEKDVNRIDMERQKIEMGNEGNLKKVKNLEEELTKESEKVESSCRRIDELLSSQREERDAMLSAERDFGRARGELEREVKLLREKLEVRDVEAQEYCQAKQQLEEAQNECNQCREVLERSKQSRVSLEDSLREITLERDRLQYELKDNIRTHQSLIASTKEEKIGLEKAIANYKNTMEELESKLHNQTGKVEETEYLLKQKDEELFTVNEELDSKIGDVERLEKETIAYKDLEVELRRHLGVVTQELEKYKCGNDNSEELIKANEKIKELEETLVEKNSKVEEEHEEILAKTKEFILQREKEYTEKVNHLEAELSKREQLYTNKCEEFCQLSHRLEMEQTSKEILIKEIEEREEKMDLEKKALENGPLTPGRFKALESELEEERKLSGRLQEKCVALDDLMLKEQTRRIVLQKKIKNLQDEIPNLEEKEEKISALELYIDDVTQRLESVKAHLEEKKEHNAALEKEVEQLKDQKLNLEERLQNELQTKETMRTEYEQLQQKQKSSDLNESVGLVSISEHLDSLKVSELECYIEKLKKEMVDQDNKIAMEEESLKRALESQDSLEHSLNEKMKENLHLQKDLKEKLALIGNLQERITTLEGLMAAKEEENQLTASEFKSKIKCFEKSMYVQKQTINDLEEKTKQLELAVQEKNSVLTSAEKEKKELGDELEKSKVLVKNTDNIIKELKQELQHTKTSLKHSDHSLEAEKQKTQFMERLKEKVVQLEKKCGELNVTCADYEIRLNQERQIVDRERKELEAKIITLSSSCDEANDKLNYTEEHNKAMMQKIVELEEAVVMIPNELDRLERELEQEKENATRYQELSRQYLDKLNELNSVNSQVIPQKQVSKDKPVYERVKETMSRHGPMLKEKSKEGGFSIPPVLRDKTATGVNQLEVKKRISEATKVVPLLQNEPEVHLSPITQHKSKLDGHSKASKDRLNDITATPIGSDQVEKSKQISETVKVTPSLFDEQEPCLSPITRSLSGLGFSSPAQEKDNVKKTSKLPKSSVTSGIQKPRVNIASNLPADKKRKDEAVDKGKVQSDAKRVKLGSVSGDVQRIRSPFLLRKNRNIQTRSKTSSSQQSRLAQPSTRTTRSRIPKRSDASTNDKVATGIPKTFQRSQQSDECKMQ